MTPLSSDVQSILEILRRLEKHALAALQARKLCTVKDILDIFEFAVRLERLILGLEPGSQQGGRRRRRRGGARKR